jgi:hypothetical protein
VAARRGEPVEAGQVRLSPVSREATNWSAVLERRPGGFGQR